MEKNMRSDKLSARFKQALFLYNSSAFDKARQKLSVILAEAPFYADALYLYGLVAFSLNDTATALLHIQKAIEQAPDMPHYHKDLGVVYKTSGKPNEALASYQRAIALKSDYTDAYFSMGNLYRACNEKTMALECFKKVISIDPGYSAAYMNMNAILKEEGCYAEIEKISKRMTELDSGNYVGFYYLGLSLMEQGQPQEALGAFSKAISINPNSPEVLSGIGQVFYRLGRTDKAIIYFEKVISLRPDDYTAHMNLGHALAAETLLRKSVDSYKRAIAIAPANDEPFNSLGEVYQQMGDFKSAIEAYHKAIRLKPLNSWAYYRLSEIIRFEKRGELFNGIQQLIKKKNGNLSDLTHAHFALGKIYNDLEEYRAAFENYRHANTYCQQLSKHQFNMKGHIHTINVIVSLFNKQFFSRRPNWEIQDQIPVFVIGMPRSGTTLLSRKLSDYTEFHEVGELEIIENMARQLMTTRDKRLALDQIESLTNAQIKIMANQYLEVTKRYSQKGRYLIDKMPHNFQNVWLISLLFPHSKIIHCRRHPLDTCLSNYFTNFPPGRHAYATDLTTLGRYYLQYERLMAHWKSLVPGAILDVEYEAMVRRNEETIEQVLSFIGAGRQMRRFLDEGMDMPIKTASSFQARQKIYHTSVERWKNYAEFITPLLDILA